MTEPLVQIVDDDSSFLNATARLLQASGFAVRTFSSASEFLAQRDPDAPGCVVADLQMPGINGLDLQLALAQTRNPLPTPVPHRPWRHRDSQCAPCGVARWTSWRSARRKNSYSMR